MITEIPHRPRPGRRWHPLYHKAVDGWFLTNGPIATKRRTIPRSPCLSGWSWVKTQENGETSVCTEAIERCLGTGVGVSERH